MQEIEKPSPTKELVLELRQITKSYPGVIALDGVNLAVHPNEIVGLVGENGAGKSTLMKILIGNVQPDQGSYRIRGQAVRLRDPAHAIRLGVVHGDMRRLHARLGVDEGDGVVRLPTLSRYFRFTFHTAVKI